MHHTALAHSSAHSSAPSPATPRPALAVVRDEVGASTAEYATVTGCGVGFAAVLFKFLTSDGGQQLISLIFRAIRSLLPF